MHSRITGRGETYRSTSFRCTDFVPPQSGIVRVGWGRVGGESGSEVAVVRVDRLLSQCAGGGSTRRREAQSSWGVGAGWVVMMRRGCRGGPGGVAVRAKLGRLSAVRLPA